MSDRLVLGDAASYDIVRRVPALIVPRPRRIGECFNLRGCWDLIGERNGVVIWKHRLYNLITNQGKNKLLDVMLHNDSQIATWYIGLIQSGGTVAATDTHASHPGWTEEQQYEETTRREWTEGAASSQSITNPTPIQFTIDIPSGTLTIFGLFLASISTKGSTDSGGTLFSAAAFSGTAPTLQDSDVLKVTYTVNA